MWFRELVDVDGDRYRLYHRRGNMYAVRLKDDVVLFDRPEGDRHDGAGSNQTILAQTADIFEMVTDGTACYLCQAMYPNDRVPDKCYVCDSQLIFAEDDG